MPDEHDLITELFGERAVGLAVVVCIVAIVTLTTLIIHFI